MRLASVVRATVRGLRNGMLSGCEEGEEKGNHRVDMYAKGAPPAEMEEWLRGGEESGRVMIDARIEQQQSADERRSAPREAVEVDARVRELGSEGCEATVLNISATGFMAEVAGEFDVGARVWLILPARERANAVVRWVEGRRIGAEFAEPIDLQGLLAR